MHQRCQHTMRAPCVTLLLLSLACVVSVHCESDASACASLGFNSALVLCSDCDLLEQSVRDEALAGECRGCCVASEGDDTVGTFATAVLELDNWKLQPYPELNAFVEKRAAEFPGFSVRYSSAWRAAPTLILRRGVELQSDANQAREVRVSVAGWKADALADFLRGKLRGKEATA